MKKYNFLFFGFIIFLMIILAFAIKDTFSPYYSQVKLYEEKINKCQKYYDGKLDRYEKKCINDSSGTLKCIEIDLAEYCKNIEQEEMPQILDAFNATVYTLNGTIFSQFSFFLPLLIICFSVIELYRDLKSGFFRNKILIIGYKNYICKIIRKVWRFALILPVLAIVTFIICSIISKNFDYQQTLLLGQNYIESSLYENFPLFCFTYIFVFFLHSLFWINLGIICTKKNRNYASGVLCAFLLYIGYCIISEIFGVYILPEFLGIKGYGTYTYMGIIWSYENVTCFGMLIYGFVLAVISTIIVYIKYHKQEDVVISNEV